MTVITIMRPGMPEEVREVELPAAPGYRKLDELLRPLLDGNDLERVNVFWSGAYTDMFVDETSALKGPPRNEAATAIYRNNWLTHQEPGADPESLPAIYGPAVLFNRRVWF